MKFLFCALAVMAVCFIIMVAIAIVEDSKENLESFEDFDLELVTNKINAIYTKHHTTFPDACGEDAEELKRLLQIYRELEDTLDENN